MRRITAVVRPLVARIPGALPDIMLIVGFVVVAQAISDWSLVLLWLGGVPFLAGLATNVDAYRARRRIR